VSFFVFFFLHFTYGYNLFCLLRQGVMELGKRTEGTLSAFSSYHRHSIVALGAHAEDVTDAGFGIFSKP
jgi:hypothetical protein